jgi:hypothetical protein
MSAATGCGSSAPPADRAHSCRARFRRSRICSRMARLRASDPGHLRQMRVDVPSTWRSVSETNPRLTRSPRPAAARRSRTTPRTTAGRAGSGASRVRAGAVRTRPGGRLPRAPPAAAFRGSGRIAGERGLAVVERLGGDLAGVIDPHQARDFALLALGQLGQGASGAPPSRRRSPAARLASGCAAEGGRPRRRSGADAARGIAGRTRGRLPPGRRGWAARMGGIGRRGRVGHRAGRARGREDRAQGPVQGHDQGVEQAVRFHRHIIEMRGCVPGRSWPVNDS